MTKVNNSNSASNIINNDSSNELNILKIKNIRLNEELIKEKENSRKLLNDLNIEKQKNLNLTNHINLYINKINELTNIINVLQSKIKELQKEFKNLKFEPLNCINYENIIAIMFKSVDQKINISFPCKSKDIFVRLEEKLYEEYPEYKEYNNYFTVNGRIIKRFKSLEENSIKNGDIILLNIYE